jgi:hypothetical protein
MPRGIYERKPKAKKKPAKKSKLKHNPKQLTIDLGMGLAQPTSKEKLTKAIGQVIDAEPSYHKKLKQIFQHKKDELDLLRDMLATFESLSEDARFRAYAYFKNKFSAYDITTVTGGDVTITYAGQ